MCKCFKCSDDIDKKLEELSFKNPLLLIECVQEENLEPVDLTIALEAMGRVPPKYHKRALKVLKIMLNHPKDYVREGSIYGLQSLIESNKKEVLAILKERLMREDDKYIKRIILSEIEKNQ